MYEKCGGSSTARRVKFKLCKNSFFLKNYLLINKNIRLLAGLDRSFGERQKRHFTKYSDNGNFGDRKC